MMTTFRTKKKTRRRFRNFLNNFLPDVVPKSSIDALAKRVLRCEIRADTNVSDQENVVLMMHLCKILQVALERALVTAEKRVDDYYYYSRKERENELLKEKVEEQKRVFNPVQRDARGGDGVRETHRDAGKRGCEEKRWTFITTFVG